MPSDQHYYTLSKSKSIAILNNHLKPVLPTYSLSGSIVHTRQKIAWTNITLYSDTYTDILYFYTHLEFISSDSPCIFLKQTANQHVYMKRVVYRNAREAIDTESARKQPVEISASSRWPNFAAAALRASYTCTRTSLSPKLPRTSRERARAADRALSLSWCRPIGKNINQWVHEHGARDLSTVSLGIPFSVWIKKFVGCEREISNFVGSMQLYTTPSFRDLRVFCCARFFPFELLGMERLNADSGMYWAAGFLRCQFGESVVWFEAREFPFGE